MDNFNQADLFADILPPMPIKPKPGNRTRPFQRSGANSTSISKLPNLPPGLPEFRVVRKERRKRSISAFRSAGIIEIHIPARLSKRQEIELIPEMIAMVLKREAKARKGDEQLLQIALKLLEEYLPDFYERPTSITWRNMNERWVLSPKNLARPRGTGPRSCSFVPKIGRYSITGQTMEPCCCKT